MNDTTLDPRAARHLASKVGPLRFSPDLKGLEQIAAPLAIPYAPTAAEWDMIGNNITFLTLALLSALITGPSFLIAHAIIPSAVDSKTISDKFNKLRPILYVIGFLGLSSIITFFLLAFFNIYPVLERIYPRFWQ